ncbi:serine threonine- kinase ppk4-like [Paramuricea clavata]|nr:serine threonine- kinase ppk4-like [Paramuricea clavata]
MVIQVCEDAAENEKKILSLIETKKSPFIVSYRNFVKDNRFMYLIVDLCEETLDEHVHSQNIQHLRIHGRRMIREMLTGLKFLHDQGILHRDLKPSNILVDVDGHLKLADFGISRVLNEDETTVRTDAKGTEGWMAVEVIQTIGQVEKGRFKRKSDIQSAGMIAFFILTTGGHPFGSTKYERMTNIVAGNPVNLLTLDDPDGRQFVSRLISHRVYDRPYALEALLLPFMDE